MKKIKRSLIVASFALSFIGNSQSFVLPKLKYAYSSLETSIDSTTMLIHHSKHHQTYITNLNKALLGTKADSIGLTELLLTTSSQSEVIRNNAGGHFNHSLFWEILTPKKDTKPSLELMKAIESNFTSLDSLKKVINKAASNRFGSGWAWLIVTPDNKLVVSSTANQDNPLMDIIKDRGIPILGIDVWEHAYYLKYQNKRADYLGAIWNVIDWEEISKKYSTALNNPLLKKLK